MKKCKKCEVEKPLSEFHKHKGREKGVTDYCKPCRNNFIVEKRHNLEEGRLQKMKDDQSNRYAICNSHSDEHIKGLSVDHCHTTNTIRGLLCTNCNNGLGRFKDNIDLLKNAIKYLKKYGK